MVTIAEAIEIEAPVGATRAAWNSYVTALIVGAAGPPGAPEAPVSWHRVERDAGDGAVQFTMTGSHRTRVTVALEFEPADEDASDAKRMEDLRRRIGVDLHQFREFAESRLRRAG
jgi:uncharacterized membrane protein